jgi:hypothetical protein
MRLRRGAACLAILALGLPSACSGSTAPNHATAQMLPVVSAAATPMPAAAQAVHPATVLPKVESSKAPEARAGGAVETPHAAAGPGLNARAAVVNPLTGLPVRDTDLMERRPLAIKISNYPRDIRPQYGLNEADVVFEYYIEWGYTRFIGIFYGNNASQIGPVRSGRYFDEHITRMFHAYYVFNYADPREYTYFLGGDLQSFTVVPGYGSCPPFFQHRISSLITDARHYETYFDSTRFEDCLARKGGDNSKPDLMSSHFTAEPSEGGVTVDRVFTYYSRCDYNYWQYDPESSAYLRFQETSPSTDWRRINDCQDNPRQYVALTDSVTGDRVAADNIVVIYVSHTFANANEQDDEIYHIDLIDSGRAFVFRDGLAFPARWTRTDIDQPLVLTTTSGEAFGLRPGRTFFQVLGETSKAWSDGADWQFEFHTP